ncbi:succinate dehydrogenase, hydrophobic membrane anchor protein [Sphingomonas sp. SUN039]|uniref:succinate dehydrogenase, hydrophobic membrane anchor protein n=1 Tax=Sphingomonas sp. SUN039 TaxID=2937787 RepID=UPI002164006C|nr:succinate dehydrogenase, hydrophobic membrane anchor protein [Sphingomonas sp. SUN039]UVO54324.1 succinate dehydrogenase, hydrophobic membrane anchor protein [Sphingomonas sp. SUN039]
MRGGSEIKRVRGLGSAKHGAGHWWQQRVTAFANVILMLWLVVSLVRLPNLDYGTVHGWMQSPFVAVPLALIVINTFWHFKMGLQVVIEDYQHGESRIIALGLLNIFTFGAGALALFAILKIALTGSPA